MPYINKPCDHCGKTDNPVRERYQCVSGTVMEFKAERIGDKLYKVVPKNLEYWCSNCYKVSNQRVEEVLE